ncbi:mechanosensitive ion channel family protein [Bernardetia sp.]|uniref:mechanosensitive ion channel family protein n=1 Tax=Bernardetia sp. TaxID=1937974 RepID=UPI0025BFB0F9|nr:mechanosensitive ion channel [Bernardetia sp.]
MEDELDNQIDLLHEGYVALRDKLIGWFETLVAMLPNFFLAVIVLLVFYFIAKAIRVGINRALTRLVDNRNILELATQIIFYVIMIIGTFVALGVLNLDKTVTSLLAGAGVIGLALSFAFQDLATNFISGIFIAVQKPLQIGDLIQTHEYIGYVKRIGLRAIDIENFDGQYVIIPSKDVFQTPLLNYNRLNHRRVNLPIGVSYGDDIEKVERLLYDTIRNLEITRDDYTDVRIDFDGFGDSSVNFIVRFWINHCDQPSYHRAYTQAGIAIKKAFDKNDITIPFPIRTLDFGIKGGEKMEQQLAILEKLGKGK